MPPRRMALLPCGLSLAILLCVAQSMAAEQDELQQPARQWVVYLLPHSHVDIVTLRAELP